MKPPLSRCGMPHANSATSRPRVTSPRASREHLAVLGGDQGGDVLLALVEQLAELEQHLGALGQRDAAPLRGPGLVRGGDDLADEVGRGEVELAGLLAGRGVEDRARALGGALPGGAVDEVGDAGRGRAHGVSVLVRAVGAFSVSEAPDARRNAWSSRTFGHRIGRSSRGASRPPPPGSDEATSRAMALHVICKCQYILTCDRPPGRPRRAQDGDSRVGRGGPPGEVLVDRARA